MLRLPLSPHPGRHAVPMCHPAAPTMRLPAKARGFTLLESLITIVLVVFGISALLTAQSTSLRISQDGHLIGMATNSASSMIDRIRANSQEVDAYVGTINDALAATDLSTVCATPNNCSQAEQVVYDQVALMKFLDQNFPKPTTVTIQKTTPDPAHTDAYFYTLEISWGDLDTAKFDQPITFNTIFWI